MSRGRVDEPTVSDSKASHCDVEREVPAIEFPCGRFSVDVGRQCHPALGKLSQTDHGEEDLGVFCLDGTKVIVHGRRVALSFPALRLAFATVAHEVGRETGHRNAPRSCFLSLHSESYGYLGVTIGVCYSGSRSPFINMCFFWERFHSTIDQGIMVVSPTSPAVEPANVARHT